MTTIWDVVSDWDIKEGTAHGLLALMAGISQDYYCAAWMHHLEYDLWKIKGGAQYGQGTITENQANLLKLLSEESRGWWFWNGDEPEFCTLEEWTIKLRKVNRA